MIFVRGGVSRGLCAVMVVSMGMLSWMGVGWSDELAAKGRRIFAEHLDAIVTVQLVIKLQYSFGGSASQNNESKEEITGTVIDATGLTVVSLSETDPSNVIKNMMGGQSMNIKMESEVTDVTILLKDGTEVEAEIVLRDNDLDLAFVRPLVKPEEAMAHLDLRNSGEPKILDEVISINRLGKVAGRAHSASVERIQAIITKPRTFYVPGENPTQTGLGSPAFTLDGKVVGVFVMRSIKSTGGGSMFGGIGGARDNIAVVILPSSDILDAAEQAPPFGGDE